MLLSVLAKPEGVFWRLPVDLNRGLFCIFSICFGYQRSSNSQNHSYILLINAKLLSLIILPEFKSPVLVIFSATWRLQQLCSWIQGGSPGGSGRKGIFTQSDRNRSCAVLWWEASEMSLEMLQGSMDLLWHLLRHDSDLLSQPSWVNFAPSEEYNTFKPPCAPSWSTASQQKNDVKLLEQVQRKVMKTVRGLEYLCWEKRLRGLGLLSL